LRSRLRPFVLLLSLTLTATLLAADDARPGVLGVTVSVHMTESDPPKIDALIIDGLVADGPAERAGLHERDVIRAINDTTISFESPVQLLDLLGAIKPGAKTKVSIERDGEKQSIVAVAVRMDDEQYAHWLEVVKAAKEQQ